MLYQRNVQIVLEGADVNNEMYGRVLATQRVEGSQLRVYVSATGTYLICVGDTPACGVEVIRLVLNDLFVHNCKRLI